jgi:UTP--glucose-1-phosphate uridylyltransferase
MKDPLDVSSSVLQDMVEKGVDPDITSVILSRLREGRYAQTKTEVGELPSRDDPAIIDCTKSLNYAIDRNLAESSMTPFRKLGVSMSLDAFAETDGSEMRFEKQGLYQLGLLLSPFLSYGVLNGGSATSYADETKNRGFSPSLFNFYEPRFNDLAAPLLGRAKGVTPAFVQPDGSPGPGFLELKMRALLLGAGNARSLENSSDLIPLLPMFQMTSSGNNDELKDEYETYRSSPLIEPLLKDAGFDVTKVETAVQPLITAFTRVDGKWDIFTRAHGKPDSVLPLPGGHGQCFATLKSIFQRLYNQGKRFVQLGNVDNLGNMPQPEHLALLALSGAPAGFEFAYRTPVDVKGGVLVRDTAGTLTCADIGPAITVEEVIAAESAGTRVLFNCATGLFSLEYLIENIDRIIDSLPLRVSNQEKDAGNYKQAEQITWEVMGLLENPMVFGVNKYRRFLAAKLFMENMLTSGIGLDDPLFPRISGDGQDILETATRLHEGLQRVLNDVYGMALGSGRWHPNARFAT